MIRTMLLRATPWEPFASLPIEPTDTIAQMWYEPTLDALCVVTAAGRRFTVDREGTPTEIHPPAADL